MPQGLYRSKYQSLRKQRSILSTYHCTRSYFNVSKSFGKNLVQDKVPRNGLRQVKSASLVDNISSASNSTISVAKNSETRTDSRFSLMRSLMSRVVHPIAVVTGHLSHSTKSAGLSKDKTLDYEKLCAMTVSSINTVTLEPKPIISFNIRQPSRTRDAVFENGRFYIHFLTASAPGEFIGRIFAKGDAAHGFSSLEEASISWSWEPEHCPGPQIQGAGILARLGCQLLAEKCVEVGDHIIVVATVESIDPGPEQIKPGKVDFSGLPGMSYVMRSFKKIGQDIRNTHK